MSGQTTNPPPKIPVVDDEPQLVALLTKWLEEDGYQVYGALDGAEALRLFDQYNPVLSITDLRMPGMDGYQVISYIRKISQAHVLVVTALGSDENIVRGLDLGADEFMVKPLSKKVFKARVPLYSETHRA